jgi:hypothetical protein
VKNLSCSLFAQDNTPHVDEHGYAHSINELKLPLNLGIGRLPVLQENAVPNHKGVFETELPSVHAANPSQHETFGLHILELDYAEQVQIHVF